jgi:competence protein ComEC
MIERCPQHCLLASLCAGIAAANVLRLSWAAVAVGAGALTLASVPVEGPARLALLAAALALAGLWWGSIRLEALDRSPLSAELGRSERTRLVVTGPSRQASFDLRVPAVVEQFGRLRLREPVLLQLPLGRSPPQGARLETVAEVAPPRGPSHGFDERTYLRRHGIHVVLHADGWRVVGERGGIGGLADRLRARLRRSVAPDVAGERRAVIEGVVLGDDQGLSQELRDRFRASGLYHLLAVSGQNVVLVAAGMLGLAWALGLPRWLGELGALAGIGAYVLAVGLQPSVVRAGISGALASLAWLTARGRDRWYFLLLGALTLLAWNPYTLLDAGFQLSFSAVLAIFVLVPRLQRRLEGYPIPKGLADALAISTACGLVTAPVLWLQFHAVPLLTVPANALAAPAAGPLLGLGLGAALVEPISPGLAGAIAWVNGWCAAYLAGCARLIGGLPGARISSGPALLALSAVAALFAAWLWRPRKDW